MLVCIDDPRENPFYVKRAAIAKETAKLKGKGNEKQGLPSTTKQKVLKRFLVEAATIVEPSQAPKRRRLSADKRLMIQSTDVI